MSPQIVIIGPRRREFLTLLKFVATLSPQRPPSHVESMSMALAAETQIDGADLILVLQSVPDQYLRSQVEALIGRTLFGRLLCCYGPWCESDGRTRDIWPDAVRVAVRLAPALVQQEFAALVRDEPAMPPTASRDEVFANRLQPQVHASRTTFSSVNAAVISADRTFRKTITQHLLGLGVRSVHMPLVRAKPRETIAAKETHRGPIHIVMHDLDPWNPMVEESIELARQMFPAAQVWGIATMPDAGLATETADCPLNRIVPKLDMELGLRWHLQQGVPTLSSAAPHQSK